MTSTPLMMERPEQVEKVLSQMREKQTLLGLLDPRYYLGSVGEMLEQARDCIARGEGELIGNGYFLIMGARSIAYLEDEQHFNETMFVEMLLGKHRRYGAHAISRWGLTGTIIRLDSKYQRAYHILMGKADDAGTDESVVDTIQDIVGYCVLGYLLASDPHRQPQVVRPMSTSQNVREFHHKQGFAVGCNLEDKVPNAEYEAGGTLQLRMVAHVLSDLSKRWENGTVATNVRGVLDHSFDLRLMRGHLLCEELSEVLTALADRDELMLLDGLADLDYVTHGTGVSYDLPLEAGHVEVHKSNMTKEVKAGGKDDLRCRTKGESYVPPDLRSVLSNHRPQRSHDEPAVEVDTRSEN